jgi:hypothetical protein
MKNTASRPGQTFVARVERSEIREAANAEVLIPDCAALHPGYKLNFKQPRRFVLAPPREFKLLVLSPL